MKLMKIPCIGIFLENESINRKEIFSFSGIELLECKNSIDDVHGDEVDQVHDDGGNADDEARGGSTS